MTRAELEQPIPKSEDRKKESLRSKVSRILITLSIIGSAAFIVSSFSQKNLSPILPAPAEGAAPPWFKDFGDPDYTDGQSKQMNNRTIYVNGNATGENTGLSWQDAFTDLQSALQHARQEPSPVQIWVAKGIYKPSNDDREASFQLANNIGIYGGFNGSESSITQRDLLHNQTVLSGEIGDSTTQTDNSYNVVTRVGILNRSARLDGFTITGANNDQPWHLSGMGGGLMIIGSPILANLTVEKNKATEGGGLWANGGPYVVNSIFMNNDSNGAVIYPMTPDVAPPPLFVNCIFTGNISSGVVFVEGWFTMPQIANSTIIDNQGWGIRVAVSNLRGDNLIVSGNTNRQIDVHEIYPPLDVAVSHSLIQGGFIGVGNIDVDPQFIQGSIGRITSTSPVIDKGDITKIPMDIADLDGDGNISEPLPVDLDGNPRIVGRSIDMGSYEGQPYVNFIYLPYLGK